jgi:hypothetical protein
VKQATLVLTRPGVAFVAAKWERLFVQPLVLNDVCAVLAMVPNLLATIVEREAQIDELRQAAGTIETRIDEIVAWCDSRAPGADISPAAMASVLGSIRSALSTSSGLAGAAE